MEFDQPIIFGGTEEPYLALKDRIRIDNPLAAITDISRTTITGTLYKGDAGE